MTTMLEELVDWAVIEEMLDDRPCFDCAEKADWIQTFVCCGRSWPKCDVHKKKMEEIMRRLENCRTLTWNCRECGAKGKLKPAMRIWELVTWEPL